jgi:RND family efflux transporter MFP subunit
VEAGDEVKEGDIIAILEQEPFDRAITDAERELEHAEFALQLAEERVAADESSSERRVEMLAAADRVRRAEGSLAATVAARRHAVILAPVDGIVIQLAIVAGEIVAENQIIARIAGPRDLGVVASVDELDIPNVTPGANARMRIDAYPDLELDGVVVSTAPEATRQGGTTVFSTRVSVELPAELDVRPGMNVQVTIVTAARENALLVPDAALRTVGDRSFVTVLGEDGREEREVVVSYRASGKVEVASGLREGERVVLR